MANRQHMKTDNALMARLHAACRAPGAVGLHDDESGDYLIEGTRPAASGSTLGSSINYNPQQA